MNEQTFIKSRPDGVEDIAKIAHEYDRVALVLQGGGALGAYQAGVYQALHESSFEPDWLTWISGVSIGAINAAIIAGNPAEKRLEKLKTFWTTVSGRSLISYVPKGDLFHEWRNQLSSVVTMFAGQPGFFTPRFPNPWLQVPGTEAATSIYDTSALKETLLNLVDFDLLNNGQKRLSVGAVNIRTGNFTYFDTKRQKIGPEHIMASGALPPALPAIEIDGEYYWDGGIVSNTPLQYLLEQDENLSSLVFQVDLFGARGDLPRSMSQVLNRQKEIIYSSRTRQNTDAFAKTHRLVKRLVEALRRIPPGELKPGEQAIIDQWSKSSVVNIVHLIYQHKTYEGNESDYNFSEISMREHWTSGYEDTLRTLRHPEWLQRASVPGAVAVHDLHRDDPT